MTKEKNTVKEPLFHVVKRATIPVWEAWGIRIAAILLAMVFCGIVAFFLIDQIHAAPKRIGDFYNCFLRGNFSTGRKIFKYLKDTSVLLCISLAVTPAFRMKFWNIGAEGQTLVGVLSAIGVAFYLGGKVPEVLLLVLMLVASLISGGLWGLVPALCKAKWNTNETLFTLMMNYVATYLVSYCLLKWIPNGSSSLAKLSHGAIPAVQIPGVGNSYLPIIAVALILTVGIYIYLNYSKHGYEISVVGGSVNTAKYVGIDVKKVILRTMLVSGMLCGLSGYLIAAGLDQTVTTDSVGGQGFTAIMVSWLAKFDPIFMIFTAGLIIFLKQGAAQISQDFDISSDFPNVVVGIILLFVIGCEFFINYRLLFRRKREKEANV